MQTCKAMSKQSALNPPEYVCGHKRCITKSAGAICSQVKTLSWNFLSTISEPNMFWLA
jgi:hypothetical protein